MNGSLTTKIEVIDVAFQTVRRGRIDTLAGPDLQLT